MFFARLVRVVRFRHPTAPSSSMFLPSLVLVPSCSSCSSGPAWLSCCSSSSCCSFCCTCSSFSDSFSLSAARAPSRQGLERTTRNANYISTPPIRLPLQPCLQRAAPHRNNISLYSDDFINQCGYPTCTLHALPDITWGSLGST